MNGNRSYIKQRENNDARTPFDKIHKYLQRRKWTRKRKFIKNGKRLEKSGRRKPAGMGGGRVEGKKGRKVKEKKGEIK